jgi:hypothetical protein
VTASPQSFKVLVLDALNGKPQTNVRVDYFCEGQVGRSLNSPMQSILTGSDGVAQVPFGCRNGARIELSVLPPGNDEYSKEECGGLEPEPFDKIMANGFISDPSGAGNIWCPRKVSRKLKPVPGEVIIFVKKPTWWQVHVAG